MSVIARIAAPGCPACRADYAMLHYAPGQCVDASCGDRDRTHGHLICSNPRCVRGQSEED
jgi:hypothetical protein